MSFKPKEFKELIPATIAISYNLNNILQIPYLCPMLQRHGDKAQVGQIIEASFENMLPSCAGETGKKQGYMKNAIMIVIKTQTRDQTIKLFKDKMHSCGFKDEKVGLMGIEMLIDIINEINSDLIYLQSHIYEYQEIVKWLTVSCKRNSYKSDLCVPDTAPQEYERLDGVQGSAFDQRILKFVLSHIPCYQRFENSYELYLKHLKWLSDCRITSNEKEPLAVTNTVITMLNFNYDLGFTLKKIPLALAFQNREGWAVRFDNMIDHSVNVSLPYESLVKKKSSNHSFSVHHEGKVTQSSPNRELAKEAYEKFMAAIVEIKKEIIIANKPVMFSYRPVYQN